MISKIKNLINNYRYILKTIKKNDKNIELILEKINDLNKKQENQLAVIKQQETLINELNNQITLNFKYSNLELLNLDRTVKKKKILIVGFYGAPNVGDELMLETLLDKIGAFSSDLDITIMLSENISFDITNYPGFKFLHYPKNLLDLNVISDYFDCVIYGGGALLDDSDYNICNGQLSLGNILINLSMRMISFKKKVIFYGLSSSNKLSNQEYIYKLNYIIKNSTYFSLRDTNSLEVLKETGIDVSNIHIVHDIVLSNQKLYQKNIKKQDTAYNVGIIYICSENNYAALYKFTKNLITYLNNTHKKYKINLIPFYEYRNNDTNFYLKLTNQLNSKNIFINKIPRNFTETVDIISKNDIIISMRYHSTLLANFLGKKVINIKYDLHNHYNNKINYIYEKYGFFNNEVLYTKIDDAGIEKILENSEKKDNITKNTNISVEANNQLESMISKSIMEVKNEKK